VMVPRCRCVKKRSCQIKTCKRGFKLNKHKCKCQRNSLLKKVKSGFKNFPFIFGLGKSKL
jgi:hypothetical protein